MTARKPPRRRATDTPAGAATGSGSPTAVRAFLARHGLAAARDRGQNFLWDEALAARLAEAAGVHADETVLEIGTGLGILTRALAARARRVVSVEVDAGLVRALRAEGALPPNVELRHQDARRLDWDALAAGDAPLRVVANLPYAVATPLLRRLLDHAARLAGWSILVQREVAARLSAAPGERDYGSLAVLHALVARVRPGPDLPPACFHPAPRVVSRLLHVTPRGAAAPGPEELARIERVARAGFAHRRKTVVNSLRAEGLGTGIEAALAAVGIDPRARAETLEPALWRRLASDLHPGPDARPPGA